MSTVAEIDAFLDQQETELIAEGYDLRQTMALFNARWFGPRCPDFDADCCVCKAWRAYDLVCEITE